MPQMPQEKKERKKKMNKVILMGRLTRDPSVTYTNGDKPMAIARYFLAVQRRFKKEGDADADFINCVSFGKTAEFAEKYFRQGMKICISGRIQTGSYVNREGVKVYTTDVIVEEQDFCESKGSGSSHQAQEKPQSIDDGFMAIPDGFEEQLPFN